MFNILFYPLVIQITIVTLLIVNKMHLQEANQSNNKLSYNIT